MAYSVKLYLEKINEKKKQQILSSATTPAEQKKLQKELDQKKLPVFLYLRFNGKTIKVYTERKFSVKQWDSSTNMPKGAPVETTIYLNNLTTATAKLYEIHLSSITKELVKSEIDRLNERDVPVRRILSFYQFVNEFIHSEETSNNKGKGTISVYRTTLNHIKNFAESTKYQVNWQYINLDFYDRFKSYLRHDVKMPDESTGMLDGTIGKYIKTIKTWLNEAAERGYEVNPAFKSKKFKVDTEEAENIYLDETEILALYNHDFSMDKRLDRTRDLFVAACWLGLRFSDLSQVSEKHIQKNKYGTFIRVNSIKTGENVVLPCNPIVEAILKKYNGKLPNDISNQKMNENIKDVCKAVGFQDLVTIHRSKGNTRIQNTFSKHKLVTTHTARRSFATNLYLMKVPTITIMAITGHRTEKSFMKYIKVTKEQHAQLLMELMKDQKFSKTLK